MKIEQISADSILGLFALIAALLFGLQKIIVAFDLFSTYRAKLRKKKMKPYYDKLNEVESSIKNEIELTNQKMEENFQILKTDNRKLSKLEIIDIYENYRREEAVPAEIKAGVLEACEEYFANGGNSYIREIVYPEIKNWKTK